MVSLQNQTTTGSPINAPITTTASTRSPALHLFQSAAKSRIRHLPVWEMRLQQTRSSDNAGQNIGGSCGVMAALRTASGHEGLESRVGCAGGRRKDRGRAS